MQTAKLFKNGRSQAVRLPKEFQFEGDEVIIKRHGEAVLLLPKHYSFNELKALLDDFDEDFQLEREQPAEQQERDFR
jgi:antitoxin VapB